MQNQKREKEEWGRKKIACERIEYIKMNTTSVQTIDHSLFNWLLQLNIQIRSQIFNLELFIDFLFSLINLISIYRYIIFELYDNIAQANRTRSYVNKTAYARLVNNIYLMKNTWIVPIAAFVRSVARSLAHEHTQKLMIDKNSKYVLFFVSNRD